MTLLSARAALGAPPGDIGDLAPDGRARQRRPRALLATSMLVVAVLALPLAFLLTDAAGAGVSGVWHLIWRSLTVSLLWNTIRLTVVVTGLCAVVGTLAAYGIERTDLPGRHVFAVLVVIPFAIPDFVVSFAWSSLSTWVQGFRGAVLVMTLAVYPLVYLPVAASLRGADPGQEEIARSLGASGLSTFFRVTLGQARRAILGGCLLVALVILAEYGAFEILGFQTFSTEIFTEYSVGFAVPAACALSLVLVALSLLVLVGESSARGAGRLSRTGPGAQRGLVRKRLGRARPFVLGGYGLLVLLGLGVPVGIVDLLDLRGRGARPGWPLARLGGPLHGRLRALGRARGDAHGSARGFVGDPAPGRAAPFARADDFPRSRHARARRRLRALVLLQPVRERASATRRRRCSSLAYAIMFFPLALVCVRASLVHAPVGLEEVAGSLGVGRLRALCRVTLPLVAPGIGGRLLPGVLVRGHRAHGDADPDPDQCRRPRRHSSGPTSRTSPTARRPRSRSSSSPSRPCRATCSGAFSTGSPLEGRRRRPWW